VHKQRTNFFLNIIVIREVECYNVPQVLILNLNSGNTVLVAYMQFRFCGMETIYIVLLTVLYQYMKTVQVTHLTSAVNHTRKEQKGLSHLHGLN